MVLRIINDVYANRVKRELEENNKTDAAVVVASHKLVESLSLLDVLRQ